jgi:hypothetical protein
MRLASVATSVVERKGCMVVLLLRDGMFTGYVVSRLVSICWYPDVQMEMLEYSLTLFKAENIASLLRFGYS